MLVEFNTYLPLLGLLVLLPLLFALRSSLVNRPAALKVSAFIMRCTGVILLLLALCRPFWLTDSKARHIAFLVDVSESVSLDSVKESLGKVKKATEALSSEDSWELFCFADGLRKTDFKALEKMLDDYRNGQGDASFRKATNISEAVSGAAMTFPAGKIKQIVICSDGAATERGVDSTLNAFHKDKGHVFFSPLKTLNKPEAAIVSFSPGTTTAYPGETVRFTAELAANRDMKGRIKFLNRGVLVKEMPVEFSKNSLKKVIIDFPVDKRTGGVWQAQVEPENDYFPENNRAVCTVRVKGATRVLVLHIKPQKLKLFARALKKQGIDLEVRGRYGFPGSLRELLEFDAVILANFPADLMSVAQMNMLRGYVRDFGRGLIMTGSEHSFGLGGYYKTPVEEVLPAVSRYEKEKEQPSLSMVLVVDKSGSMNGLPIALARQAARAAVDLLGGRDQIGVVAFDGQAYTIVELTPASDKEGIKSKIDTISAGGGTNLYPAMLLGQKMLERTGTRLRHMIILSDGQSMPGDFTGAASDMADKGMTISTVALGGGAHRELMSRIAEIGKGRCYMTMDAQSVPRIFVRETIKASRSAIKEEPFVPVKIGSASFLSGIDFEKAPFLLGYVMTRIKPSASPLLLCENGAPLLAIGRFGLGQSIAFTSGITPEWAGEWMEWQDFGKFWSQLIRVIAAAPESGGIRIMKDMRGKRVRLSIKRYDEKGDPVNGVKWQATLTSKSGGTVNIPVVETGYGSYFSDFEKPQGEACSVIFKDSVNGQSKTVYFDFSYPEEFRLRRKPDEALGKLKEFSAANLKASEPASARKPMFDLLTIAALFLIIGGIFLRRI
jgi:uncharacterized membrane protein